MSYRALTFSVCAVLVAHVLKAADLPDPHQPSTAAKSSPVTYDAELIVTVTAPYKTKSLKVWLPIPPTDDGQVLQTSELTTFPDVIAPKIHSEPLFGNRFAFFEFRDPQGAQIIRHKFRIKIWELRWNLDPNRIQAVSEWPKAFDPYRRSESQAVVADARFDQLLREIVPVRRGPLLDLRDVMFWVDRNLIYDHSQASLTASSVHAFELRRGHCSDYHGFCAAIGRLLNQPTSIAYGINTFPKSSPSHCKLEAFLVPYGWVSFDVSETQKQCASLQTRSDLSADDRQELTQAARRRLTQGFRDNTWFRQTRGTDYELVPPASAKVPVVRTIYAEADGKSLPDPDPSDKSQFQFSWMTAHRFQPDRPVKYPYMDVDSLREWIANEGAPQQINSGATK